MKDLIERLRLLEIDHAPDGWPAIRMCDVSALLDALEQMAAALAAKDEALRSIKAHFLPDENAVFNLAEEAIALQPHAELVAKMKADAVRSLLYRCVGTGLPVEQWLFDRDEVIVHADRIERGEVK